MTGYKKSKNSPVVSDEKAHGEELNKFYTRFDKYDFSTEQQEVLQEVCSQSAEPIQLDVREVVKQFRQIKTRSAAGPDMISGRLLRECRGSLAPVFLRLFQQSVDSGYVPHVWKTATIVPVAKKPSPQTMNDFRPVALTPIPFKCMERMVLNRLKQSTDSLQDPHQFAYRAKRGTDDAIITLLHSLVKHLELRRSYARILFIDFSSAFNTIQPHIMMKKLLTMEVNPAIIKWIFSFLTGRKQSVRVGNTLSSVKTTNTGAPQGCVLSPALFTLYTTDCRSSENDTKLIKFADDTSLSGYIISDESCYRRAVESLVEWCDNNFLELNVGKTKEMVVDFRVIKDPIEPIIIKQQPVEQVRTYQYLGTVIDEKLTWTDNILDRCSKAKKRMHSLRQLKQFRVGGDILSLFFRTVIQSSLLFNSVCYLNSATAQDRALMEQIVSDATRITGCGQVEPMATYLHALRAKTSKILKEESHPLHPPLVERKSLRETSNLFRSFGSGTKRFLNTFLPSAVRDINAQVRR